MSTRVRTAAWFTVQRKPSAMSRRRLRLSCAGRSRTGSRTRDTSTTAAATSTSSVANGQAAPAANSAAPIGGPISWLRVMKPVCSRALATVRSSRCTSIGVSVPAVLSANTSATVSRPIAASAPIAVSVPVSIVATSPASTRTRARFATIMISRRSCRSDSTPAYRPNTSGGAQRSRAASEIRNGSSVSEVTSSGPAASATPSPRLLDQDEASSQR